MIDHLSLQGARIVLSGFPAGRIPADVDERHRELEPMVRALWYAAHSGGRTFPEVTAQLRLAADLFEAGPGEGQDAVADLPRTEAPAEQPAALREIADHMDGWPAGFVLKVAEATPTREELLLRHPRLQRFLLGGSGKGGAAPGRSGGSAPPAGAVHALIEASHPYCLWELPGLAAECREALVYFGTEDALGGFFGPGTSWTVFLRTAIDEIAGHMRRHHPSEWQPAERTPPVSVHGASEFSGAEVVLAAFRRTGIPADIEERHALADPMIRAAAYAEAGGGRTAHEVAAQLRTAADRLEADPAHLPQGSAALPRATAVADAPAALRELADRTVGRPAGDMSVYAAVTPTGLELLQRFPRLAGMLELDFGQDGTVYEVFEADDAPEDPTDRELLQAWIDGVHGRNAMCRWEFPALAGECQEALVVFRTQEALRRFFLVEQLLGGAAEGWVEWLTLIIDMTAEHLRVHHPPVRRGPETT